MDERNTGQEGSLLVFFRVADIQAFRVAPAFHHEFDILAFDQAGALPLLIVAEEVRGTGGGQEGVDIAPLAVADDRQFVSPRDERFHDGTQIRIDGAGMRVEIFHLVGVAAPEDFVPAFRADSRLHHPGDFLHRHAHDAVDVVRRQEGQGRIFRLEDFVPGFGDGYGGIPQGSVQVKEQQGIPAVFSHACVLLASNRHYNGGRGKSQ